MSFYLIGPEVLVLATAIAILVGEMILGKKKSPVLTYGAMGGLGLSIAYQITTLSTKGIAFSVFTVDNLTIFARLIITACLLLVVMVAESNLEIQNNRADFLSLLLFAGSGAMILSGARDLITFYIGLELLTIPSFVLVALNKKNIKGGEAAIKYFILGVLASTFLLYGMSIVYGFTGQTDLVRIAVQLDKAKPMLLAGVIMMVGAVSFKITAVPFHFWAPDAYEGALTPVAAFIATVSKTGAFAGIIRLFAIGLAVTKTNWILWFGILSVITMTVGNLTALAQKNIKRMLAYSGIAHAGYMLIGIALATKAGLTSTLFYLATYVAATAGAFFVISAVSTKKEADEITDFAGLSKRNPAMAFLMSVFLMSLVGLPPFAGFIGKVYLFGEAVKQGALWLALFGVINSVISFGYYSKVLKEMYFSNASSDEKLGVGTLTTIALTATAATIFAVVLFQEPILNLLKGIF